MPFNQIKNFLSRLRRGASASSHSGKFGGTFTSSSENDGSLGQMELAQKEEDIRWEYVSSGSSQDFSPWFS